MVVMSSQTQNKSVKYYTKNACFTSRSLAPKPAYIFSIIESTQWRIQDFPEEGAPTPKSAITLHIFCRKLHENERIWTPLDPPMQHNVSLILSVTMSFAGEYQKILTEDKGLGAGIH